MSFERALQLHREGRLDQAAHLYEQVLSRQPRHRGALNNLAVIRILSGDLDSAEKLLGGAIRAAPNDPSVHSSLGYVRFRRGLLAEALKSLERALALQPGFPEALNNQGLVLDQLGRLDEALASYDRALKSVPNFVEALNNRASALAKLDRLEEGLDSSDRALALSPNSIAALSNRGIILHFLNRLDEAVACFDRILALSPDAANIHWYTAMSLLLGGNLVRGWREFEWRWRMEEHERASRRFPQPGWLGEDELGGRTILLHAEQGLGDTVQFSRYAPLVAARGGRVILEVQTPLKGLLGQLPGVSEIFAEGDALPAFDVHCPLGSLPLAFGTDMGTIPSQSAYLRADPAAVARWRARLGPGRRRRVGLVWSGNPNHRNDRRRSIPLADLAPLLSSGVELIGLQRDVRAADRQTLDASPGIRNYGEELDDFAETAALMTCLDLIVSVDSAPVHIAGALGIPVWVLLPFSPDWRWLLGRGDSPWYPSARLFRQPEPAMGDWTAVVARVADELTSLASG